MLTISSVTINLYSLGWYNWRGFRNVDYVDMFYVCLFIFILWVSIHAIDYVYRIIKGKKK